jgi:Cell Wall Hydrolase
MLTIKFAVHSQKPYLVRSVLLAAIFSFGFSALWADSAKAQDTALKQQPGICENSSDEGPGGLSCDKNGSVAEENLVREYAGRNCVNNGDQNFCMVCNTYFESAFEPFIGKLQVGRTVMERKLMGNWGHSNCSVIWAYKQFSWTFINQSRRLPGGGRALEESVRAALLAQKQGPNGATHYYNPHIVRPSWARSCHQAPLYAHYSQGQIGQHLFLNCGGPSTFNLTQLTASLSSTDEASIEAEQYMTSGNFMVFDDNGQPLRDETGRPVHEVPETIRAK